MKNLLKIATLGLILACTSAVAGCNGTLEGGVYAETPQVVVYDDSYYASNFPYVLWADEPTIGYVYCGNCHRHWVKYRDFDRDDFVRIQRDHGWRDDNEMRNHERQWRDNHPRSFRRHP